MKKIIKAKNVVEATGPFNHAVSANGLCFTSGQLPLDINTGEMELEDITRATKLCMNNIKAICEEQNKTLADVVKTTIYVANIEDYANVNEIYASYFTADFPARTAYEVAKLPFNSLIEIEAIIDVS